MIDPKTGYTSFGHSLTFRLDSFKGGRSLVARRNDKEGMPDKYLRLIVV